MENKKTERESETMSIMNGKGIRAALLAGGKNDTVPLPKLPGNSNQTPTREQDQFFTALVDWVEKGAAPGEILLTSRDNSVSYPVCVYPLRTRWNGNGDARQASNYSCR